MALGGGGSTYITDYSANFYNPANLLINDKSRTINLGFFVGGSFFNGIVNFENPNAQKNNYLSYFETYNPGDYAISPVDRNTIIDTHYKRERLSSVHQARLESIVFGLSWKKQTKAYSIAFRSRIGSGFEAGRNWYSDNEVVQNGVTISNQNLVHKYQVLHELSFGYSESIPFINGLSSRLDNFIVGIAPKFIFAGPYLDASWKNRYEQSSGSPDISRMQSFEYQSAGNISDAALAYLSGTTANDAVIQNVSAFENEVAEIHGYGIGLDVGFTYLITFGSDLSTLRSNRQQTRRSLRVSFSVTDIGFVNYNNQTLSLDEINTESAASDFPTSVNEAFVGAPGQYLNFVDQYGDGNPFSQHSNQFNEHSFSALLPTALNGGILIELDRLKLMGDMNIGISNSAFNTTKVTTSVGAELRPLNFLPLRGGLQFTPGLPGSFNLGTAFETKFWDLSLAMMVASRSFTTATNISGAGVAVLQFHL